MNPVQKALWFVEGNPRDAATLDAIARHSGVSPYHLTRAFAAVTGLSLMRYVRARRLSEAARELERGAPSILAVALDAGYGSHEAFTRAFREHFGTTPEQYRNSSAERRVTPTEAITMDETPMPNLAAPRIETSKPQLLAGLSVRYRGDTMGGIPAQWQRLHEVGGVPDAIGQVAYGACYNTDDDGNLDYLCGFEVADFTALPKGFGSLRVPEQKYAVFHQPEHISTIRRTFAAIWTTWLPKSGHKVADAPVLERYGAAFDAVTGNGGFEIWVPIER